jgi:L-alanine-DL-glutamate epimerase-like enolase superfamily enzyme
VVREEGSPDALAIEAALLDLVGKEEGRPVSSLLGIPAANGLASGYSIGEAGLDALLRRVREHRRWPVLKIKMHASIGPEMLAAVREIYGGTLWVDANGGWQLEQAKAYLPALRAARVAVLEQPLAAGQAEAAAGLRSPGGPRIALDEDVVRDADVGRLAACADLLSFKPERWGGLCGAAEAMRRARAAGVQVALGCRTASVAVTTAAAHLAGLADVLDLDGHCDMLDDPFDGLTLAEGKVSLGGGPGSGIVLRADRAVGLGEPDHA